MKKQTMKMNQEARKKHVERRRKNHTDWESIRCCVITPQNH
jgi:hypothetical protein